MKTISHSDIIYANITRLGRTLYSCRLTGYGSVAEVVEMLFATVKGIGGLVRLELRNATRGVTSRHNINFGGTLTGVSLRDLGVA